MFFGKNSRHRPYNFSCNHRMRSTCKRLLLASAKRVQTCPEVRHHFVFDKQDNFGFQAFCVHVVSCSFESDKASAPKPV